MKNIIKLIMLIFIISIFQSCATTKKHKKCRGNGGWYNNRNL
jgi:hypothetical protein